jgi:hypothetical protein
MLFVVSLTDIVAVFFLTELILWLLFLLYNYIFHGVSMVRFRWRQQYQRRYPDEFLDRSDARYEYLRVKGRFISK